MTRTLGELLDGGYTITAFCEACRHSRGIDLAAMAERFSRAATVYGAIDGAPATVAGRPLRCSKDGCRSYRTSLRLSPRGLPSGKLSR